MKNHTRKKASKTPNQHDTTSAEDVVNVVMRGIYEINQGLSSRTTAMDIFYENNP